MLTEKDCKPFNRYLFATEYFSDEAIKIWQQECIKRLKDREKGELYHKYIRLERQENQVAVFTLYAYADLELPKKFNCIFNLDNPEINIQTNYELSFCTWEAWLPVPEIGHGHKHLCIFTFEDKIPDILDSLHKEHSKFSSSPPEQTSLGFCNTNDFDAIFKRRTKINSLKAQYGAEWWKQDDGE